MLLMNGYLRKAQHDENNLNIEVTVEVISDFKVKKASVFNGFKRQTTKSTASRLPAARLSSPSADFIIKPFKMPPSGAAFFLRSFGAPSQMGRRCAPYKCFGQGPKTLAQGQFSCPELDKSPRGPRAAVPAARGAQEVGPQGCPPRAPVLQALISLTQEIIFTASQYVFGRCFAEN